MNKMLVGWQQYLDVPIQIATWYPFFIFFDVTYCLFLTGPSTLRKYIQAREEDNVKTHICWNLFEIIFTHIYTGDNL